MSEQELIEYAKAVKESLKDAVEGDFLILNSKGIPIQPSDWKMLNIHAKEVWVEGMNLTESTKEAL